MRDELVNHNQPRPKKKKKKKSLKVVENKVNSHYHQPIEIKDDHEVAKRQSVSSRWGL
jgi:hypothetical protein